MSPLQNLEENNFASLLNEENDKQKTNLDKLTDQTEESSNSLPQNIAKRQPDHKLQQLRTTSSDAAKPDEVLFGGK